MHKGLWSLSARARPKLFLACTVFHMSKSFRRFDLQAHRIIHCSSCRKRLPMYCFRDGRGGYSTACKRCREGNQALKKPGNVANDEVVTKQLIESMRTNGSFTRATLAYLGVAWPPTSGWRDRIIGKPRKPLPSAPKSKEEAINTLTKGTQKKRAKYHQRAHRHAEENQLPPFDAVQMLMSLG